MNTVPPERGRETGHPIRVLVVDDSALVRRILTEELGRDPGIEVVGVAPDAKLARSRIKTLRPDVVTLDIEMPGMDGLAFLSNLMRLHPLPVVVVSAHIRSENDMSLRALELGAIDCVAKPVFDIQGCLAQASDELISKVKAAARVKPTTLRRLAVRRSSVLSDAADGDDPAPSRGEDAGTGVSENGGRRAEEAGASSVALVAIGASTGGVEALREILPNLPSNSPPIIVVQHMLASMTRNLAARMNELCALRVEEAKDCTVLRPGRILIAPGGRHVTVEEKGNQLICRVRDGERINGHCPSIDLLFDSVANSVGGRAIGLLLTGMGDDGAQGLLAMRAMGAHTIAQDHASSLIWGMPGEAVKRGAAVRVLPLERIVAHLIARCRLPRPRDGVIS